MFTQSALFYDAVYGEKNYAGEAEQLHALIAGRGQAEGAALLDVACGTGGHVPFLRRHYAVEGLDLDPNLLEIARIKNPGIVFHQADMTDFDLGRQFDVLVCLFSAIGYVQTPDRLRQTLDRMRRHLRPGGLLVLEPWLLPDEYREGLLTARFVDQPQLKLTRLGISAREGSLSILDFHYLVGTPEEITHFTERHALGLFSHAEYLAAFEAAGLTVAHHGEGLTGRGLYLGQPE